VIARATDDVFVISILTEDILAILPSLWPMLCSVREQLQHDLLRKKDNESILLDVYRRSTKSAGFRSAIKPY